MSREPEQAWCIVLAGGQGSRLAALTRAVHGVAIPKQYAILTASGSLLQMTMARMTRLVPASRTVVVVQEEYLALAAEQLEQYSGVTLVGQPRNLGTAVGILLGLAQVRRSSPTAPVVVVPADHYVERPAPLLARLAMALTEGDREITLVSVPADGPETGFGWIVPGAPIASGLRKVRCFVEKPDAARAEHLFRAGAAWNTFIFTAAADRLWEVLSHEFPEQAAALAHSPFCDRPELRAVYQTLAPADFSADVLTKCTGLRVMTVTGVGWADWGTPERVLQSGAVLPEVRAAVATARSARQKLERNDCSGEAA